MAGPWDLRTTGRACPPTSVPVRRVAAPVSVGGRSEGDDEEDPPGSPGDQAAAQAAGVPELDYARDGELDLVNGRRATGRRTRWQPRAGLRGGHPRPREGAH